MYRQVQLAEARTARQLRNKAPKFDLVVPADREADGEAMFVVISERRTQM